MDKLIFANHIVAESIFEESTFEIAFVNCAHGHYLWRRVWNKPCNCPTKNSMNYSCPMLFTSLGQDIMIGILPPPIPPPILNVENLFYSHVFLCSNWNKLHCITTFVEPKVKKTWNWNWKERILGIFPKAFQKHFA